VEREHSSKEVSISKGRRDWSIKGQEEYILEGKEGEWERGDEWRQ
jgi:hypothetical protein